MKVQLESWMALTLDAYGFLDGFQVLMTWKKHG